MLRSPNSALRLTVELFASRMKFMPDEIVGAIVKVSSVAWALLCLLLSFSPILMAGAIVLTLVLIAPFVSLTILLAQALALSTNQLASG